MEIIDSHTHWGPSVTMDIEVTTEELLRQAKQSGVSRIVIFPFPSMALADEEINERLLDEASRVNRVRNSSPAIAGLETERGIISNGVKNLFLIIDELVKSHILYVVHASTSSARTEYQ